MSEPMEPPKCDHVIGIIVDESVDSDAVHLITDKSCVEPEVAFNYCPVCGAELPEPMLSPMAAEMGQHFRFLRPRFGGDDG